MSVTLSGSTVVKQGSDQPLNYVLFLGSGTQAHYDDIKNNQGLFKSIAIKQPSAEAVKVLDEANIDYDNLSDFASSLKLQWTGSGKGDPQSKNMNMPLGMLQDSRINLDIKSPEKVETLANSIRANSLTSLVLETTTGANVLECTYNENTKTLEGIIHIGVVGYPATYSGEIDSSAPIPLTSPDPGEVTFSSATYSYKSKLEICSEVADCKDGEKAMKSIGFTKESSGRFISEDFYKISNTTLDEVGVGKNKNSGNYEGASDTFFFLAGSMLEICGLKIDRFCCALQDVQQDSSTDSLEALIKDKNYRMFKSSSGNESPIPKACDNNSCKVDAGYKKPVYEALAKHLTAAGFSQIVPSSFTPVEARYLSDPSNPDGSEKYTFVGYDLSGRRTEIHNIASNTSTIIDIKDRAVGFTNSEVPEGGGRLNRDPQSGALDSTAAHDLCFATSVEDLEKLKVKQKHIDDENVFTHTVYANVIKETVWKMAEIWRQTARLTLRKPKGDTIADLEAIDACTAGQTSVNVGGKKVYCDKILVNGGQEEVDAYVFGTDLQLENQLFSVFESYAAAAGYKLASEKIEFALDLAYSESNDETGTTQTAVGTGSIVLKDIINTIKNFGEDGNEEAYESTIKDQIRIDTGDFDLVNGAFNVHDIKARYTCNFWNNWSIDFGFDPFVDGKEGDKTAWDTFKGSVTWKMKEGRMLTLSAGADGSLGLDASWRIDPKDPTTYAQQNIAQRLTSLEGAMIQSGLIWDQDKKEAKMSASLSKNLSEAVNASISLTDASVTVALDDEYGDDDKWYGNIDLAFTANFGMSWPGTGSGSTSVDGGKEAELGSSSVFSKFKNFASASLDISQKKNLLVLGNNLGRISYEGHTLASAGQMTGAIAGIKMQTLKQFNIVYQNNLAYEILGLPMNIHPTFGGAIGFSMHKVKSTYFGTEYEGYKFSMGIGMFGLQIELHSRKKVIEQILQRKKYKSSIPLLGNLMGWAKFERDQDYIARAWPCLVYNIINWSKEDFQKEKYLPDVKAMRESIWTKGDWKNAPGRCELLKALPDVGMPFEDFHRQNYEQYNYLNVEAQAFYEGGAKDINGYDRWDHWIDGDTMKAGKTSTFPTASHAPVWWTVHPWGPFVSLADAQAVGAKETDLGAAPTIMMKDVSSVKDKWVNQNGNTIDTKYVTAVRQFNAASWSRWPNMKFIDMGSIFISNDTAYANSAQFAYMYYQRDKSFGDYPCKNLFIKWKKWYLQKEQFPYIDQKINAQLYTHGNVLMNELDGLTKDVTTTDSLFDQIFIWVKGKITGTNGRPVFDYAEFIDNNPSVADIGGPVAGTGNTVGAGENTTWLDWGQHQIKDPKTGISTTMYMLTRDTINKVKSEKKNPDTNDIDADSAVALYKAHPDWGIVKAYFTYMAPMGEHEAKILKNDKWVDNPEYYKPYDPRTTAAQNKRAEIKQRNASVLNGTIINITYWNGAEGRFDVDYEVIPGQPAYRDEFGNTRIEMFRHYRPGWVYTRRGTNSIGEIVWVVPARGDLYKHQYHFDFDSNSNGWKVKNLMDVGGNTVTDVCTARKTGVIGVIFNFFGVIGRLFGKSDYFLDAYRSLPWVYTDATNASQAPTLNAIMGADRFKYFPKGSGIEDLQYPLQNSGLSYHEVPWKGNNNSSYLTFYEFMEKVESDAKRYFFPEYIKNIDAEKANSFCDLKTKTVRALGILKNRYILEKDVDTCKSCTDLEEDGTPKCNGVGESNGSDTSSWDDGLGEVVGLKSMMGEHHQPSDDLTVTLNASLSYTFDRPWSEYMTNPSAYGSQVNYWSDADDGYIYTTNVTFSSLTDKFSFIYKRINPQTGGILKMLTKADLIFKDSGLTIPFDSDKSFVYPNNHDPNRKYYNYSKGESVSNINEIANLTRKIQEHTDSDLSSTTRRLMDISYNHFKLMDDFRSIGAEPKYVIGNKHKYTDIYIGTKALNGSISIGKQNCYSNTLKIAQNINHLIDNCGLKNIAQLMASKSDPVRSVLTDRSGIISASVPTKIATSNYITSYASAEAQIALTGQSSKGGGTIGKYVFGNEEAYSMPHLDQSYVDSSVSLVKKFMSIYPRMQWLFGKSYDIKNNKGIQEIFGGIENPSSTVSAELQSNPVFYNKIKGDLGASYYMMSVALSGWTNLAMDVIEAYWSGKIGIGDCVWNLNRRLWPLISAMNEISPNIYVPKKQLDDLKNNHANFLVDLNSMGIFPTTSTQTNKDFYQGISFSSLDALGMLRPTSQNWTYTLDDLLFVHRNNVLRLLFNVPNVNAFLASGRSRYTAAKAQKIFSNALPVTRLAYHQWAANTYNRALVDPNVTIDASKLKVSDLIMNSLCKAVSPIEADGDTSLLYRQNGRDRFETNDSNFIFTQAGDAFTTRVFGDDNHTKTFYTGKVSTYHHRVIKSNWDSSTEITYTHHYGYNNIPAGMLSVPYMAENDVKVKTPTIGNTYGQTWDTVDVQWP